MSTFQDEHKSNHHKHWKRKQKRSDPVYDTTPFYAPENRKIKQKQWLMDDSNRKVSPTSSITQRLRTDLGRSVGVTTATQLVWFTGFIGSISHFWMEEYKKSENKSLHSNQYFKEYNCIIWRENVTKHFFFSHLYKSKVLKDSSPPSDKSDTQSLKYTCPLNGYRRHPWQVRLVKQEARTPHGQLVSSLVYNRPWKSTVVLYCTMKIRWKTYCAAALGKVGADLDFV